jgi:hypothetical protein
MWCWRRMMNISWNDHVRNEEVLLRDKEGRNILQTIKRKFYILLTVRHVTILGKWPTWCTILFYVFIFIFNSLHVSRTSCSSSGEANCVNTTFGNCHSGNR